MTGADANAVGWYPDPAGVHRQRFWSGTEWTARVADAYGVIAVHHLDGDFASPGGGPVVPPAAPARPAGPSLSLVAAAEPPVVEAPVEEPPAVVAPVVEAPPVVELPPVVEAPPLAVPSQPEPVVFASVEPPAAGWYPDPSGIHCERSWDGSAWSAVVVDRNRVVLEHAIRASYAGPVAAPAARLLSGPRHIDLVAGIAHGDPWGGDGWHFDPTGPFRERFVVGGRASAVVRVVRGRVG